MATGLQIKEYHPAVDNSQWGKLHEYIFLLNTNLGIYEPIDKPSVILICTAIQEHFKDLTAQEIKTAFELYVTLQLELQPEKFKILSVLLVSQILNSYKKYKKDLLLKNEHHRLPPPAERKYIEANDMQTFNFYLITPYEQVQSGLKNYHQAFLGGFEWVLYNRLDTYGIFPIEDKRKLYNQKVNEMKGEKNGAIKAECERLTVRRWIQNHLTNKSDIKAVIAEIIKS